VARRLWLAGAVLPVGAAAVVLLLAGCRGDPVGEHLAAGAALEAQGRLDDALREYEKAQKAEPEAAAPHWARAQVYRRQNRAVEALGELQRYVALLPDGPHADTARRQIEALRQGPKPNPWAVLAGQPVGAPAPGPQASATDQWVQGQWNLAARLEQAGQYDAARRAFGYILTREPNFIGSAPLYEHMAYCSVGLDPPEYSRAAHYLRAAAKLYRRSGSAEDADRCLGLAADQQAQAGAGSALEPAPTASESPAPKPVAPEAVVREGPAPARPGGGTRETGPPAKPTPGRSGVKPAGVR